MTRAVGRSGCGTVSRLTWLLPTSGSVCSDTNKSDGRGAGYISFFPVTLGYRDRVIWSIAVSLSVRPAVDHPELLAEPVAKALAGLADAHRIGVAEIDPDLADTAAFCAAYGTPLDASANCVVILGKRGDDERFAACLVLATTRADVNGLARRTLDARKASFAPMDRAVATTAMEYGGITPIGLPSDWPLLIDATVAAAPELVIGSGIRGSKLLVPGDLLAALPGARVLDGLARQAG